MKDPSPALPRLAGAGMARRRYVDRLMRFLLSLSVVVSLLFLALVVIYLAQKGLQGLNWAFFTQPNKPVGVPNPGVANAILGTLLMVGLAAVMAVPIGVVAGLYAAEYGKANLLGYWVHYMADVLSGIPSIVVGIFVYAWIVIKMGTYSGFAGSVALAIIMLPVIVRTTEEMLRLVPDALREAGLALGLPRYKVLFGIVLPSAWSGIVSAIILAIARASGETAPLLFTALSNQYISWNMLKPMASLPVTIFNYAISPYDEWHVQAWAAGLTLLALVLVLSLLGRLLSSRQRSWSQR